MDTRGQQIVKALVQAALAALVVGAAVAILLLIRTPLCDPIAEDCAIDDYGTTLLSTRAAGFVLLIAVPIASLRAKLGWWFTLIATAAALLANIAWYFVHQTPWIVGLGVAAVALLATAVLMTTKPQWKWWFVAPSVVLLGVAFPFLAELKAMQPTVSALQDQGGALVPNLDGYHVIDPQVAGDQVSYGVGVADPSVRVELSHRDLPPSTPPCTPFNSLPIATCVEIQPGIWRGSDANGFSQFWVRGENGQWAHVSYVPYGDEALNEQVRASREREALDVASSLTQGSAWRVAVGDCQVCERLRWLAAGPTG